jgi:hypothetical protein
MSSTKKTTPAKKTEQTFAKDAIVGYSMKLKAKAEFVNPEIHKTDKGGYLIKGTDGEGNKMALICSADKAAELIKAKKAKKAY